MLVIVFFCRLDVCPAPGYIWYDLTEASLIHVLVLFSARRLRTDLDSFLYTHEVKFVGYLIVRIRLHNLYFAILVGQILTLIFTRALVCQNII